MRAIRWLKENNRVLRERTGAPDFTWLLACEYLADVHNITSDETLHWKTPWEKRRLETPDISAYIQFSFWEKVYYLDNDEKFPSAKQHAARWVGVAHNVGDKLTFRLITEDTEKEIERSVIIPTRLAENKTVTWDPALDIPHTPPSLNIASHRQTLDQNFATHERTRRKEKREARNKKQQRRELRRPRSRQPHEPPNTIEGSGGDYHPDGVDGNRTNNHETDGQNPVEADGQDPDNGIETGEAIIDDNTANRDAGKDITDVTSNTVNQDNDTDTGEVPNRDNDIWSTMLKPPRKQPYQPRPALTTPSIAERRSTRNRRPRERLNLMTRNAFLATVAGAALTMFPNTTQLIDSYTTYPIFGMERDGQTMNLQTTRQARKKGTYFQTDSYNHEQQSQLRYLQSLDLAADEYDPQDAVWNITSISNHRILRKDGKKERRIIMKAHWINDRPTWIHADAVRIEQPAVLAEYAIQRGLEAHPDWKWIALYKETSKEKEKVRRAFKTITERGTKYKFGIEVPRSIWHALMIDKANGNNLWQLAIETELSQINEYETFRTAKENELKGQYVKIPYHFVFDVKFDLRRKARLVAGGNHTQPPKEDILSGVVGMDTVRLGFLLAALNNLEVCAADIGNAFLYGTTNEKVYITAGAEFGEKCGTNLIIDKGLYGLRSSSARFHEHLSSKLRKMGYRPTKVDPDFWIKDCGSHYEYIAAYVDNVLTFGKKALATIMELRKDYVLKGVGRPVYYLGGDIKRLKCEWAEKGINTGLSAETYIANVVKKFEQVFGGSYASTRHQWNTCTILKWTEHHYSTKNRLPSTAH